MGYILNLSSEILSQVALELHPGDVINFALVNKNFLSNADLALRRHGELRKSYTLVNNQRASTLPTLVLEILSDPRVGHYVRELSVEAPLRGEQVQYTEQDLRLLERTLLESCLLPEIEFYYREIDSDGDQSDEESTSGTQDVYGLLKCGDQSFILALLLLRLPNLAVFSWQVECSEVQDLDVFIPVVRRLSLQDPSKVCSKLRQVTLAPLDDRDEVDCDFLKAFMAFPSIHSITMWRLTFVEREKPYEPFSWPETSNLTHLILDEPELDWLEGSLELVQGMMARCGKLRAFKYKLAPGTEILYSENDICGVVLQEAPLLEELTVSFGGGAVLPESVFHLRDLTKLRFLETEFWILHSWGEYDFEDPQAEPTKNLPPSLQHLVLFEQIAEGQKERLDTIIRLLHRQEDLLPELRTLELHLLAQGGSDFLGYFTRLISFIGQEKGVDVRMTVSDLPRNILRE